MLTFRTILAAAALWAPLASQDATHKNALPEGVTPEIKTAIGRGLGYLAQTQNPDGSWRSSGRRGMYPTAMTALAGMAMIGSGSTPTRGRHWLQVRRATSFLLSCSQANGFITVPSDESRPMFGHGFATLFLAQAYGMEEDERRQQRIKKALTGAVQLIARSQSPDGGWLYSPDSSGDEGSVTITQVQALRACRNAGITVPVTTIDRAIGYIRNSANPDGSIRYRVTSTTGGQPPITAAAVAVLYNAGKYDDPLAKRALRYARKTLPINGSGNRHHFYSQLYLAQANYQTNDDEWHKYYAEMSAWLSDQQQRDGAWHGDDVGTTFGTSIALTILQLPYSYVPIYQR